MSPGLSQQSRILRLLTNPWFGGIAAFASIIGIPLSIYLGVAGTRERQLTFYVNPVKSAVVTAGTTSALKVLYQDQEVKTDVTAVQVEVWNDGKESIRAENVLEPIVIRTTPVVPIIDATIRKTRRALSSIELDRTQFSRGILPLSWRILENSDGAIIQIVYAGSADVKLDIFRNY